MKLYGHTHSRSGISLIECLVYIGALGIVFGAGLTALYRAIENNASLRRNAEDITQVLTVGELWRADVRAAIQPIAFDPANQTLVIAQATNTISYAFAANQLRRRSGPAAPWAVVLPQVRHSEFVPTPGTEFFTWRWELELQTRRTNVSVRPLFTFTAVASSK